MENVSAQVQRWPRSRAHKSLAGDLHAARRRQARDRPQAPRTTEAHLRSAASGGLETLCTNPAALGGGSAPIEPLFPRAPFAPGSTIGALTVAIGAPRPSVDTPWLSFPDSYSARCSKTDGASVLQVSPRGGAPVLTPVPAANWGLHIADVNIALGDLTELVRRRARNFLRRG